MQVERTSGGLEVLVESVAETVRLGQALAKAVKPGVVIGLIGPLGAGKTQLSRSIAEALGAEPSEINSPTFTLINEYSAVIPIYHIDAYRLESGEEFEALGVDEYFEAGYTVLADSPIFDEHRRLAPLTRFSRSKVKADAGCTIGEHTDSILAEIGFDSERIAELREKGIVG